MKHTEPKGIARDIALGEKISIDKLQTRWSKLDNGEYNIDEIKRMLDSLRITIHMNHSPRDDIDRIAPCEMSMYGDGSGEVFSEKNHTNYNTPSNLYITKADLIKAEIHLGHRIIIPELNRRITYKPIKFRQDTRRFANEGVKAFMGEKGYPPEKQELWEYLKSFKHLEYPTEYLKDKKVIVSERKEWDEDAFGKFYRDCFTVKE